MKPKQKNDPGHTPKYFYDSWLPYIIFVLVMLIVFSDDWRFELVSFVIVYIAARIIIHKSTQKTT